MRKFTLISLSGPFPGSASYAELNGCGQQIGYDAQKGPPKMKPVDLAYLNGTNRSIANDESNKYFFLSMQMGRNSIDKLSDEVEYKTLPISLN